MNYKEYHKELKKKVNIAEQVRNEDRTNKTWEDGSMSQNPSGLTSNPYNEDSNPISNDEVKADY